MKYRVAVGKHSFEIDIAKGKDKYTAAVEGKIHTVDLIREPSGVLQSFIIDGRQCEVFCAAQDESIMVDFKERCYEVIVNRSETGAGPTVRRPAPSGRRTVSAPMPGLVRAVKVAAGDTVKQGEPLLILEAMKMQNELRSPATAKVIEIFAKEGKAVEKGEKLVVLEG